MIPHAHALLLFLFVALSPLAAQQEAREALTNSDVVGMVDAGLADHVIVATMRSAPNEFDLSPAGLIALKDAGVDDDIIAAMVESSVGTGNAPSNGSPTGTFVLQDATEVVVKLLAPISSATARRGDAVKLEAAEDVIIDNRIAIRSGAPVRGEIAEARQKKGFGRSGKLNMTIHSVEAVDGQRVALRASREARGSDNFGKAGVVTLLTGPFGIFVKGKDVEVPAGTEYTIFTDGERRIKIPPTDQ